MFVDFPVGVFDEKCISAAASLPATIALRLSASLAEEQLLFAVNRAFVRNAFFLVFQFLLFFFETLR